MPMAMPASIPATSTTTLTHIINDPIMPKLLVFPGIESLTGEGRLNSQR
jgi:hypothetical protein